MKGSKMPGRLDGTGDGRWGGGIVGETEVEETRGMRVRWKCMYRGCCFYAGQEEQQFE